MDEFGDIEARRDANVANLRRAFAALPGAEAPGPFAVLLGRLAAKEAARPRPGPAGAWPGPWARAGDDT